ncbi:MAG: YciI family protein [Rhizobiales bacterium]|nr:YciI family protein [Hyphomicrobiales bacterium]
MQYMFLIYNAEGAAPEPGTPEFGAMMEGYRSFTEEVRDAGIMREGAPLEAVDTATTVRVRNGSPSVVDGPFAETKEVLGGYYILECENLDEATAYAAKIPTAAFGSIEVRPVMEM